MKSNKITEFNSLIYLNDKRHSEQTYIALLVAHFKQAIKLLLYPINNRKADEREKFVGKIKIMKDKNHCDFSSFIIYEASSDYDIQSSRYVKLFRDISPNNPVSILSSIYPLRLNKIKFSLFLYKQVKWSKSIIIKGYLDHSEREYFDININNNIKNELSKTTYWLDVILDLNAFKIDKSTKMINIYLTQIKIDSEIDYTGLFPYQVISPDIPKIPGCQKPVFIFSFDGITTEDIINADETYSSIQSFVGENYWFKNAVTSSAVTASSSASLMTGLNLARHYMYIYKKNYLSPDLKTISQNINTLGQKVRSIGMHSYGLFAFGKWSPQYGYARGFSEYRCITGGDHTKYPWLDESIKTIAKNIEKPHMFAIHHPGGHPPFFPVITTPYFDQEYSFYHKNLANVDMFFGNLIHYLKINNLYDEALIIFMSDHGRSLSGLKENRTVGEFHFLEDRLRVPLIIKNPDWGNKSSNEYNLETHVSAQTMIHEIVLQFLEISLSGKLDYDNRTVDGITWVSETVDYKRMNLHGDTKEGYIGLVGYDDEFKYTLYFSVDFKSFLIKEPSNTSRYQLKKSGIADYNTHDVSRNENKRIENSAFEYLKSGLSFAKRNPPENLDSRTSMIDIL